MEDSDNDKFVDAVMPRDSIATPINTPAKLEMASNAPFNFKPTIPTGLVNSMSDNVIDQGGASNIISEGPPTQAIDKEQNKRKREPFSPEAIFPTQPEKITVSMDITA